MRVFFICQRVPFPPDRGDKITTFHELVHLAKRHEVHVFCLADGVEDLRNVEGARQHVASVTAVPVTPLGTRLRALRAFLRGGPLSVAGFDVGPLRRAVDDAFRRMRPDLVFVYSCNVAQFAEHLEGVPRVMQFADLDSLKWQQYAARSRGPMRWVYGLEHRRLQAYERRIAHAFSRSIVCTAAEAADFRILFGSAPVDVVCNGVDLAYFRSSGGPKTPGAMVFTGVMDYFPNVDAVCWFVREILPRVRAQAPDASFVICGSRPSPEVLELARTPGVVVTGRVPDIRPYVDAAEVFVAPLRMGRGVQNKVLEALAMGVPCVSSTVAWAGTVIPAGEGIVATDDPERFAAEVLRLLRDKALRDDMRARGRLAVERHYAWDTQLAALDRSLEQACAG